MDFIRAVDLFYVYVYLLCLLNFNCSYWRREHSYVLMEIYFYNYCLPFLVFENTNFNNNINERLA